MEHLWAPWRMEFIERERRDGCIFCDLPADGNDEKHHILHRGQTGFIMLNGFPYNNGHLLIAGFRHLRQLHEMTHEEKAELMELTDLGCRILDHAYHPEGYNIGMNLGKVAGAGIPGHLHVHIVPRWNGDTNFMPVLGETRVLPEALAASFTRVKAAFDELGLTSER
ncbi:MAG TPA: HIT domain-containing protein [Armatimonadota bacterium]|nr:HIT domain-containing protein [Armatimonadota bacterium]